MSNQNINFLHQINEIEKLLYHSSVNELDEFRRQVEIQNRLGVLSSFEIMHSEDVDFSEFE